MEELGRQASPGILQAQDQFCRVLFLASWWTQGRKRSCQLWCGRGKSAGQREKRAEAVIWGVTQVGAGVGGRGGGTPPCVQGMIYLRAMLWP